MSEDRNKPRNLGRLLGNIVNYMRADSKGRIPRRSKPVEQTVPRKVCKVCLKPFDLITVKITAERMVESGVCPDCQKQLDAGMMACVCGANPGAFIKPNEKLKDMAGKILQVSHQVWEEIKRQDAQKKGNGHAN